MRQIADRVIARSGEIEEMLDYMYRQLGQLEIVAVDDLLEIVVPSKALLNRSLDVKSAALLYLSVHIRHEGNGIIGTARRVFLEAYLLRQHWNGVFQRRLRVRLIPNSIGESSSGVQFRALQFQSQRRLQDFRIRTRYILVRSTFKNMFLQYI